MRLLSEDQSDVLAELLNIAFGRAAAPLARLMDRFVVLTPPQVTSVRRAEALRWLDGRLGTDSRVHVVQQAFQPTLRGEAMLVMRADRGSHAFGLLAGDGGWPTEEDERDAVLEVANLLVGACIGRLAELLGTVARYTPPRLTLYDAPIAALGPGPRGSGDLLVVHTRFEVEDTPFESYLFLLLGEDVLFWLRTVLDRMLDGYLEVAQ